MNEAAISLEDTIAMVTAQAKSHGVRLTRTKLVKLLYFVDVRSWETFGRTVTGVEWIWHYYGPYSSTVVETCDRMAEAGELEVQSTKNLYGSPEYRIKSAVELYYRSHSPQFTSLIRQVVLNFGRFSPAKIGDLSYETEPMRRVVRDGDRGDVIEFSAPLPAEDGVGRTVRRYRDFVEKLDVGEDEGDVGGGLRGEGEALKSARASAMARMFDSH